MKGFIGLLMLLLLLGCNKPKSNEGDDLPLAHRLVKQSVEVHGGQANWESLRSISFTKQTILFDSSEVEESNITQVLRFSIKPELAGDISWIDKGDSIRIEYKNGSAVKYINNVIDEAASESAKSAVNAALYVLFQPFKLLEDGSTLEFVAEDTIDGVFVNKVTPVYEGTTELDDRWEFLFDKNSNELIANLVTHQGRISYIKNLTFDSTIPLKLHHHRKSYFVNEELTTKVLRAEYFYTDYKLSFK